MAIGISDYSDVAVSVQRERINPLVRAVFEKFNLLKPCRVGESDSTQQISGGLSEKDSVRRGYSLLESDSTSCISP